MGRGAQAQTQQMTDQQLAQTNALNQQLLGQQQSLGNQVGTQYQNIVNNPDIARDQAAITGQSQVRWPARLTRCNSRRITGWHRREIPRIRGLDGRVGTAKSQPRSNHGQQNQVNFANTAMQQQMSALQGLSGLYGVDANLLGKPWGFRHSC